jgi:halogenation protein CepH
MVSDETEHFDLVVVGGGPGGSTVASFVAMDGHSVLLLEREKLPRYQIGESLLPSTVHGICRLLGVYDDVERAGFMRKHGGTMRWGKRPESWTFNFRDAQVLHGAGYAYQVERSKFDKLLLDNARKKGVVVRELCSARDVLRDGDRITGLRYQDENGQEHTVRASFVADASGNTGHLHEVAGERVFSKFFQNVALFCYFENGKRLPPPNSGNILCAAFSEGWFWYIPLTESLTSVGAVIAKDHAERLKQGHMTAMRGFIEACPIIKDYLENARPVTQGQYGQFRVRKDYSYANTKFWAPGFVLVGDAACFIDPVFSSGVHLSTYSALLAARAINTSLGGGVDETRCFEEFERRYRREYGLFYDFLISFYDMHEDTDSYYWKARKVLGSEELANEAFVRLVAGGGSAADEFFREREGIGRVAEWAVEATESGVGLQEIMAKGGERLRLRERFAESNQIMSQARLGEQREAEKPLLPEGLAPSRNGLRWVDPAASVTVHEASLDR